MISPKFEEMSKKFTDIACFKVDVDEAEDVAAACQITAIPTFQFFKNGVKVAEFKGESLRRVEFRNIFDPCFFFLFLNCNSCVIIINKRNFFHIGANAAKLEETILANK